MIHNKILYATIVFLISFFCVGFAAGNANYYNDSIRVNDLIGEDVTPIGILGYEFNNMSFTGWGNNEEVMMKLWEGGPINGLGDLANTTSQARAFSEFDCATSKKMYIDQLLQLEEFKNYSWEELEKNFMSYSEISSVLIDNALERKYETYDTVSIDENIIKMDFSSESDSLSHEKSDKQISTYSTKSYVTVPNVVVTGAYCNWRWVQNTIVGNQITLHNYGTTTANGIVVLRSEDEMLGWATSYSNLAPGGDIVISLPFYVNPADFPTVGAKPIRILAYVQVDSLYYLTSAPTISTPMIGMYNNNAGYLVDPDGGISLEVDGVHHHNQYDVARRAAVAGDGTSTPYQTAYAVLQEVNTKMTYDVSALNPLYTAADIWIIDNGYVGICDEYAVLYASYLRALGIPTRKIGVAFTLGQINTAHQFNEFWDGNQWIHADTSGQTVFSNPRYYTDDKKWNIYNISVLHDANDSRNGVNEGNNVFILHGFEDILFWVAPGLVARYC